jgi:ATP-binding cassette, subfamily B, bacterial
MRTPSAPRLTFLEAFRFSFRQWMRFPVLTGIVCFISITAPIAGDVVHARFFGKIIDELTRQAAVPVRDLGGIWMYAAILAGTWLYYWYGVAARNYLRTYIDARTIKQVCFDAFCHVQRLGIDWHSNSMSGATVRGISRGMWGFDEFGNLILVSLLPILSVTVGALIMLFATYPLFGLIMFGFSAVYVWVSLVLASRYLAPQQQKSNQADSAITGAISDALAGNAVVKSFGRESSEDARFWDVVSHWSRMAAGAWTRDVHLGTLQSTIMIAFRVVYILTALQMWKTGALTIGNFVFLVYLQFDVFGYLKEIGQHIRGLQKAISEMEDLVHLGGVAPEPVDAPDATPLQGRGGAVVLNAVSFRYPGQTHHLYQNLSLTLKAGESVALVGRSGSGKSSFIKLLQRFYDPDQGQILIDGQDIRAITRTSLRQALALVPQDPVLFHRTIAENIAYARPGATRGDIEEAARLAHAHDFIQRLPQGYDTLVGERGVKLSGGERQRVAIARAILADSQILILDEATSSLDTESEQHIQQAFDWLMQHRTTLIIAHRLSTIQKVDRVLVFDQGRIIEDGPPAMLMRRKDGAYRRMVEMQTHGVIDDDTPISAAVSDVIVPAKIRKNYALSRKSVSLRVGASDSLEDAPVFH